MQYLTLSTASLAGILAGVLQATGYLLYARHAARAETRPNTASWLMFAYGTGLVLAVEAAVGGPWPVLVLPAVCAVSSIGVAVAALRDPAALKLDRTDAFAFGLDVLLTLGYVGSHAAYLAGGLEPASFQGAGALVLAGASAASITSFIPILRSTDRDPARERAGPWVVWLLAYGLLLVASADAGKPALLLYPGMCLVLSALMAALSLGWLRPARTA